MSVISEYEKAKRTGGKRLHPDTAKNLGLTKQKKISPLVIWARNNMAWMIASVIFTAMLGFFLQQDKQRGRVNLPPQVGDSLSNGFNLLAAQIEALSLDMRALTTRPSSDKSDTEVTEVVVNPELAEPVIKWRTKWKTKYRKNPINASLRRENRRLKAEIRGLNHSYKLKKKIIDDFYNLPIRPGYRRKITFTGNCQPIDNSY